MEVKGKINNELVKPYLRSPAFSYDGKQIAFCYAGDIWMVSAEGGEARMLTSHSGYNDRPKFSPDGSKLAFMSKRTGNGDIYVMSLDTEYLQQLTYHDGEDALDCWSPDNSWLYFNSGRDAIGGGAYKVNVDGGTPIRMGFDPYESYYNLTVSPDGKLLAFNNNGGRWWRHGRNPSSISQIWIVSEPINSEDYRKITQYSGRNMYPMWDGDSKGLYFVSDRDENENIWYRDLDGTKAEQITHFKDGRLLRPSISGDGKWIVFERDFLIWRLNLDTRESSTVDINVRADRKVNRVSHRSYNGDIQEFTLSEDVRKVMFVNRGRVFAASAEKGTEKGRPAFPISDITCRNNQIAWGPDSSKAVYVSDRNGENQIFLYDFKDKKDIQLTDSSIPSNRPLFSPDGKWIGYFHGRDEIRLINAETHEIKPFIKDIFALGVPLPSRFTWSPDSKWIAFIARDEKYFSNLYVQNIDETEPRQISFLSHISGGDVMWSPDGKYIIFNTSQYRAESQIAKVELKPVPPEFREEEFDKLFEEEDKKDRGKEENEEGEKKEETEKEEKDKKPEPVNIEFEGIKHRLSFLTPSQMNARAMCISPDSKMLIYSAQMTGKPNLWSICFDEDRKGDPPKQLTFTNGGKWGVNFVKDGKKIYYVDEGKIHYLKIAESGGKEGDPKKLDTRVEMDIDMEEEKMQMFNEAWKLMLYHFYDPNFHGVNWDAVREQLLPIVRGIQQRDDFHELLNLMVGELNASHLGAGAGAGGVHDSYLGVDFDWAELESQGRFKVTKVLQDSPAALPEEPIKVGDYILAVDDEELNGSKNLWEQLKRKAKKRLILTVNHKPDMEGARKVTIQPIDMGAMNNMQYNNWVRENTEYVHEKSNGRLGYVHIRAMSYEAYIKLLVDLDTETHNEEGVVVDVRFNGGGHIASFILDVLRKRSYVQSIYRDRPAISSTNLAGNRILEKPLIMVQNEHSGSNTEMFSEGFRRFGLGKVVGTPTAGAVIWTTNVSLLDGSWFRVPFIKVATLEGQNLEGEARTVDVLVDRPLGESAKRKDSQLNAAIEHLLKQIDEKNSQ
jgi:Tol biopolymer transport system component/C-terminal processing protease CtpA/Prc